MGKDIRLRAPFPWFGGKSRVAPLVWSRLGDVRNYVEPFAGSLAVLLGRSTEAKVETVNDRDAFLCNFWRATQADPELVAKHADWPVNEADLHARHRWLIHKGRPIVECIVDDPEFYDPRIAGWWVWGQCLWIGAGWCKRVGDRHANGTRKATDWKVRPSLSSANGRGEVVKLPAKLRGDRNAGRTGVLLHGKGPLLTGNGGGVGVHAPSLHGQLPTLSGDGSGAGRGVHRRGVTDLLEYMEALSARLRRVRITCGDWSRVLGPAVTTCIGTTGILLDPPYAHSERVAGIYSEDHDIAPDVRKWALENGDNPGLRIALCGYDGEHEMPSSWECVAWKAGGGYGARTERGRKNATRERIWFSPYCLKDDQHSFDLQGDQETLEVGA